MPVNKSGDTSGKAKPSKAKSGGPFGFLNEASRKANAPKARVNTAVKAIDKSVNTKHGALSDAVGSVGKSVASVAPRAKQPNYHPPRLIDPLKNVKGKDGKLHYHKGQGPLLEGPTAINLRRLLSPTVPVKVREQALNELQRNGHGAVQLPNDAVLGDIAAGIKPKAPAKKHESTIKKILNDVPLVSGWKDLEKAGGAAIKGIGGAAEALSHLNTATGGGSTYKQRTAGVADLSISKSVKKAIQHGALATGSAVVEGLDRPVGAVEAGLGKALAETGAIKGQTAAQIKAAKGPLAVLEHGRDHKKDITGGTLAQGVGLPKQLGLGIDLATDPTLYAGLALAPETGGGSLALTLQRIRKVAPELLHTPEVVTASRAYNRTKDVKAYEKALSGALKRHVTHAGDHTDELNAMLHEGRANRFTITTPGNRSLRKGFRQGEDITKTYSVPSRSGQAAVTQALRNATARGVKPQVRLQAMLPTGRTVVKGKKLPGVTITPDLGKALRVPKGKVERELLVNARIRVDEEARQKIALLDKEMRLARADKNEARYASLRNQVEAINAAKPVRIQEELAKLKEATPDKRYLGDLVAARNEAKAAHLGTLQSSEFGRTTQATFSRALEDASRLLDKEGTKTTRAAAKSRGLKRVQLHLIAAEGQGGIGRHILEEAGIKLTPAEEKVYENYRNIYDALLKQSQDLGIMEKGAKNYAGYRVWSKIENPEDLTNEVLKNVKGSSTGFTRHRSIAAVSDYASTPELTKTLVDAGATPEAAARAAEQLHRSGRVRALAEMIVRKIQRGQPVYWNDLTNEERNAVRFASNNGLNDTGAPLFKYPANSDSAEGQVLPGAWNKYGLPVDELTDGAKPAEREMRKLASAVADRQAIDNWLAHATEQELPDLRAIRNRLHTEILFHDPASRAEIEGRMAQANVESAAAKAEGLNHETQMLGQLAAIDHGRAQIAQHLNELDNLVPPATTEAAVEAAPVKLSAKDEERKRLRQLVVDGKMTAHEAKTALAKIPNEHNVSLPSGLGDALAAHREAKAGPTKYEAIMPDGTVVKRSSDANYVAATLKDGKVSFHTSEEAAKRRRGTRLDMRVVEDKAPAAATPEPVAAQATTSDWVPDPANATSAANERSWTRTLDNGQHQTIDQMGRTSFRVHHMTDPTHDRHLGLELTNPRKENISYRFSTLADAQKAADAHAIEVGAMPPVHTPAPASTFDAAAHAAERDELLAYDKELAAKREEIKREGTKAAALAYKKAEEIQLGGVRIDDIPEGAKTIALDERGNAWIHGEKPPTADEMPVEGMVPRSEFERGPGEDPFDFSSRLPDYRAETGAMVELDPRLTGYIRARSQGLTTSFQSRWQAFDAVHGRSTSEYLNQTYTDLLTGEQHPVAGLEAVLDEDGHIAHYVSTDGRSHAPADIEFDPKTLIPNSDYSIWLDPLQNQQYVSVKDLRDTNTQMMVNNLADDRVWPTQAIDDFKVAAADAAGAHKDLYETGMEHAFGRLLSMTRYGITTPFPAYHMRNLISDLLKSLQADTGVLFHPVANVMLTQAAFNRGLARELKVKGLPNMTMEDFLFLADTVGIRTGHHAAEVMQLARSGELSESEILRVHQKFNPFYSGGPLTKFGAHREDIVRYMTFLQRLRHNGGDVADASWYTIRHHFNYNDLSSAEKRYARNTFLFYTWYRKNIPLQLAELARRPGFFSGIESTYNAVAQGQSPINVGPMAGAAPGQPFIGDYVHDRNQAITTNWDDYAVNVGFGAPWSDLGLASADGTGELFAMINPFLQGVAEAGYAARKGTGIDPLTLRQFHERESNGAIESINAAYHAIFGKELPKDKDGNPVVPWWAAWAARSVPFLGRGTYNLTGASPVQPDTKLQKYGTLLTNITGLSVNESPKPGTPQYKEQESRYYKGVAAKRKDLQTRLSNETKPYTKQRLKGFDKASAEEAKRRGINLSKGKGTGYYKPKKRSSGGGGSDFSGGLGGNGFGGGGF